jgi:hypothetical protein
MIPKGFDGLAVGCEDIRQLFNVRKRKITTKLKLVEFGWL